MLELISKASIKGALSVARDGGSASFPVDEGVSRSVENGTGAGQANAVYVDDFSIAASGTMDIDLAGALTDALGGALVFTAIKEILVKANSTNTNNVVIGAGTSPFVGGNAAGSQTFAVKPGGFYHVGEGYSAAGWAVGAGASDILRLANSGAGTPVTGTIVIIGEV